MGNDFTTNLMKEVEWLDCENPQTPLHNPSTKTTTKCCHGNQHPHPISSVLPHFCTLNRTHLKISRHHRTCQKSKKSTYGFRIQFALKEKHNSMSRQAHKPQP